MIAISNAVWSSISSTMAGISRMPASFAARQRRSPAMSWNRPSAAGRTRIGWSTPCSVMEAASSWRGSSSKVSRGWFGLGSIRSIGIRRMVAAMDALR